MAQGVWDDYDNFVNTFLPRQTIPKLRQWAEKITQHSGINLHLRSQERKQDLIDKVKAAFQTMRRQDNQRLYLAVRRDCEAIANQRFAPAPTITPVTFGGVPQINAFSSSSSSRAPAAAPARPAGMAGWQTASSSGSHNVYNQRQPQLVDWKPSPMWKPLRALTNMDMLPDITSHDNSHTRRDKRVHFQLPTDVIELLKKSKADPRSRPQYSVRLFCASSDYYRPPGMAPPPGAPPVNNRLVPIEFPLNPDAMLDDHMVPFKERGLRGKAGSAPPLDLDKGSRGLILMPGRMASLIMGHTGPTAGKRKDLTKKFWFQVVFAEITNINDLLVKLEALVPTNADAELEKLRKKAAEDDDIQVGIATLSLKDPLSGMRIAKPIRSSRCSHLQCFDARWWLEANKAHPQWLCPHCSKELNFDDLICDGYFLSILNTVADDFEEVFLEANGDWHTANSVYGNKEWLAQHAPAPAPANVPTKRERSPTPITPTKGKRRAIEILSDSEDDEESFRLVTESNGNGRANGHTNGGSTSTSLSRGPSRAPSGSVQPAMPIIDLTISSDEDDDDEETQPYFRPPGGASTSRDVAGSGRPATNLTPSSDVRNPPRPVSRWGNAGGTSFGSAGGPGLPGPSRSYANGY